MPGRSLVPDPLPVSALGARAWPGVYTVYSALYNLRLLAGIYGCSPGHYTVLPLGSWKTLRNNLNGVVSSFVFFVSTQSRWDCIAGLLAPKGYRGAQFNPGQKHTRALSGKGILLEFGCGLIAFAFREQIFLDRNPVEHENMRKIGDQLPPHHAHSAAEPATKPAKLI